MMIRFGNIDFCIGDQVIVDTYDGCCYQGEIVDIYAYAFGPWDNHGMAVEIQCQDGEYIDLDDREIQAIEYIKK